MAFYIVFGLFVVAFLFLALWVIRWAIRRDMAGRSAWLSRDDEDDQSPGQG